MTNTGENTLASLNYEPTSMLPITPSARYGVWCLNDRGWCQGTVGTHAHASAELPRWESGEASAVDPKVFRYELRRCVAAEIDELRGALVFYADANDAAWMGDSGERARKLLGRYR